MEHIGEMRNANNILTRKSEGNRPLDLAVDGMLILKLILKEQHEDRD